MRRVALSPTSACYTIALETLETNGQHMEAGIVYRQAVTNGVFTDFRGAREIDLRQYAVHRNVGSPTKGRLTHRTCRPTTLVASDTLRWSLPKESVMRVILRDTLITAPEKYAGFAGLGKSCRLGEFVRQILLTLRTQRQQTSTPLDLVHPIPSYRISIPPSSQARFAAPSSSRRLLAKKAVVAGSLRNLKPRLKVSTRRSTLK